MKPGLLLYFDSYPALTSLPMEQRGLLLTALFQYGDLLRRGEEDTLEELLDQFPQLSDGGRALALMMGAAIYRDHAKWLRTVERRQARAPAAGQEVFPAPPSARRSPPPRPSPSTAGSRPGQAPARPVPPGGGDPNAEIRRIMGRPLRHPVPGGDRG